jgi:hypothetical protein
VPRGTPCRFLCREAIKKQARGEEGRPFLKRNEQNKKRPPRSAKVIKKKPLRGSCYTGTPTNHISL